MPDDRSRRVTSIRSVGIPRVEVGIQRVENGLIHGPKTRMLPGDAEKSIEKLVAEVKALQRFSIGGKGQSEGRDRTASGRALIHCDRSRS